MLKFEIGESVRIKGTDKVGIVKAYKVDGYTLYDINQVVTKYCVQTGLSYQTEWYLEEKLEKYTSYEFDPKFELALIDLLIDIYLLENKLELVKQLCKEKTLYEVK